MGKKLYVTNFDLLEINGNGQGPLSARFVGFGYDVVTNQGRDPVLQYGTHKGVSQKFSIHSSKDYYDTPELFGTTNDKSEKYHLNLIGEPFTFVIVIRYADGSELRIPVEDDVIRIEKAVLPKGYSIRQEN